jgi:hypothetical protein
MGWAQHYQQPMGSAGPVQVLLAQQMGQSDGLSRDIFQSNALDLPGDVLNGLYWYGIM